MTPQKWHRIDPSGTGFKHSKVESGSAQLLYRYKGENDAKPYLLWKEGGGVFSSWWFWGLFIGLAVPAALWSCVCGLANVFKVIQKFS